MIPELPKRPDASHKGDYGRGLLIGGSRGMAGAIALSGMACLRAGAGLVRVATTLESLPIVASQNPCYMTLPVSQDEQGLISSQAIEELAEVARDSTALAMGPGLGQSDEILEFCEWAYRRISKPMVVDADALNCLAKKPEVLVKPGGPRILTPHLGELRRILGDEVSTPKDLQYRAESLAREAGIIFVMKGHRSIIMNGVDRKQNSTGNSGMATGGSGDVLTGIITALLCQGMDAFAAARLGCLIHGLAGDAAAKRIGKISLNATDIVRYIPKAIRAIKRKERRRQIRNLKQDGPDSQS